MATYQSMLFFCFGEITIVYQYVDVFKIECMCAQMQSAFKGYKIDFWVLSSSDDTI